MTYDYRIERERLFTDEGQRYFLVARDQVRKLLDAAGAERMLEAVRNIGAPDNWQQLACVDRMVELGELREITAGADVRGQDRIFVSARDGT